MSKIVVVGSISMDLVMRTKGFQKEVKRFWGFV